MITINGTLQQHIELNNWAFGCNEKILEFITKIDHEVFETDVYPIIIMPEPISKWMIFNCHLSFIRDFYFNMYNITEIPYGEEIEHGKRTA